MRVDKVISKCVEGKVARSIIRELEEQLIDTKSVRMYLMQDLSRAGYAFEGKDIRIEGTRVRIGVRNLSESNRGGINSIIDIYSKTYPELTFYFSSIARNP